MICCWTGGGASRSCGKHLYRPQLTFRFSHFEKHSLELPSAPNPNIKLNQPKLNILSFNVKNPVSISCHQRNSLNQQLVAQSLDSSEPHLRCIDIRRQTPFELSAASENTKQAYDQIFKSSWLLKTKSKTALFQHLSEYIVILECIVKVNKKKII